MADFCSFTGWLPDPAARRVATDQAIEENEANYPAQADIAYTAARFSEMGLTDLQAEREALIATSTRFWKPGREIRVFFFDGDRYPKACDEVIAFAREWAKQGNINFVRTRQRLESDIRITFNSGGSWSVMGSSALTIRKDRPTMQLGWFLRERRGGVVYHEFGHALAFQHEQSHPKRDCEYNRQAVIADMSGPPNNWSVSQIEFNIFRRSESTQYSRYDSDSIMHYFEPAEWFYDPSCAVMPNHELSRLDRKYVALWYPGRES